jgi:hypothetical protein
MILPTAKAQPMTTKKSMLVNLDGSQSFSCTGFNNGRSFIQYIDFPCSSGLAQDIVNSMSSGTPLIQMYYRGYRAVVSSGISILSPLQSGISFTPTMSGGYGAGFFANGGSNPTYMLRIDFRSTNITGDNTTNINDGIYEFRIDHLKNGSYSCRNKVHRLFADVNGSRVVDINDYNAIINACAYGKTGLYAENTTGSGQVYTKDSTNYTRNTGRSITIWDSIQI